MNRAVLRATLAALWVALVATASAQTPRDALLRAASVATDLTLPTDTSGLGAFAAPKLALYKPDGPGPFPAVVLHHQCGGLRSANGRWQNMSMLAWAREAVARGYVALVVDSLGPRSVDTVCMGAKGGVTFPRGVRDALQAAHHLRQLPYVDPARVVFAGYSWGAMVGVLASSATWGTALAPGERFRAVVSFYPGCFDIRPANGAGYAVVQADIDRPLLVLMGGQDTETPPAECTDRLAPLKASGAPVQWHLYPDATHCWDCENLDGLRKVDFRGTAVEYRFHRDVTRDSADRMFDFYARVFKGTP